MTSQFKKGDDPRRNTRGRPKGRRNKVSPEKEIERALNAGMSVTEFVEFMTDKVQNSTKHKLTEQALFKYLAKLIDTKSNLFDQWMKLQKMAEKEEPKGKEKPKGEVREFPKPNLRSSN